jgi:hypothetical protein
MFQEIRTRLRRKLRCMFDLFQKVSSGKMRRAKNTTEAGTIGYWQPAFKIFGTHDFSHVLVTNGFCLVLSERLLSTREHAVDEMGYPIFRQTHIFTRCHKMSQDKFQTNQGCRTHRLCSIFVNPSLFLVPHLTLITANILFMREWVKNLGLYYFHPKHEPNGLGWDH